MPPSRGFFLYGYKKKKKKIHELEWAIPLARVVWPPVAAGLFFFINRNHSPSARAQRSQRLSKPRAPLQCLVSLHASSLAFSIIPQNYPFEFLTPSPIPYRFYRRTLVCATICCSQRPFSSARASAEIMFC